MATVRFNSLDPVLFAMNGLVLTMLLLIWGRASGSLTTEGFLVPVLCKSFEFLASDSLLSDCAFKGQNTGLFLVADELVAIGIFASFIFTATRFTKYSNIFYSFSIFTCNFSVVEFIKISAL